MTPTPRTAQFMGRPIHSQTFADGTWLEGEEFAYPRGGFTRRAFALCEDGQKRLVRCSIADTFFSIPARYTEEGKKVRGFLSSGEAGIKFTAYKHS